MSFLKLVLFLIFIQSVFAINPTDHTISTTSFFEINSNESQKKFEDTILLPENFLKRFNPANVTVTKKVINGNEFEFIVVKNILGFKKTFHLLGSIFFERKLINCKSGEHGYVAHIDFSRSGPSITDTISDFYLNLCTNEINNNALKINSVNTLYYKGSKFNSIYEAIAKSLINDQVTAIFSSIKSEVIAK